MKVLCKTHGIIKGTFVGPDVKCEPCVLNMVNAVEPEEETQPRVCVYRNVPHQEPNIIGPEE